MNCDEKWYNIIKKRFNIRGIYQLIKNFNLSEVLENESNYRGFKNQKKHT